MVKSYINPPALVYTIFSGILVKLSYEATRSNLVNPWTNLLGGMLLIFILIFLMLFCLSFEWKLIYLKIRGLGK